MSDIELIDKLMSSKKPSDIFTDNWKKEYIGYSKLIHPDSCGNPNASNAMAIMNHYKDVIENGITYTDESGNFKVFDKRIEYVVTDDNRKLITKSYNNYKSFMSKTDKASENFKLYLPQNMELTKNKLVITLKDRAVPLSNQKFEQIHVNWVFSRLFEASMYFAEIGVAHMGLNPTTVFVVPETHGIIVISFYHMTALGKKAETISAKYKMWYPTNLFMKKIATPDIDLELAKKIALYLLGDRSAAGTKLKMDKTINPKVLTFLLTKHENKIDEYREYRDLLTKNFEKKFYPLNL